MTNRKVIGVWSKHGLPDQSGTCDVTRGSGIFEARTTLSSHQLTPRVFLTAMLWNTNDRDTLLLILNFESGIVYAWFVCQFGYFVTSVLI